MQFARFARTWSAAAALSLTGLAHAQQTYTISFFPELPVEGGQVALAFDPRLAEPALNGATIVEGRLFVTFTTIGDFDAANLGIQLTAPIDNAAFGLFLRSGAELGWSGQGTFSASLTFDELNGMIPSGGRAIWFFDLFHVAADPASFSGSFSIDSRIEFDYVLAAEACAADFNADGELNADDLGDFINCYFSDECGGGDFNRDGEFNADDLGDFINAYFAGCA
ncbi:MAG: hypothetical protein AB7K52_05470 [Phycisphaerales bacterium]